jgi:hypothetical protein
MGRRPMWAESCPQAYDNYAELCDEMAELVPKEILAQCAVMLARAWTYGQDSVAESKSNGSANHTGV